MGTKEVTKRTVDPFGLIFQEGIWILIGYATAKEIRSFALDRIQDCKERYRYFEPRFDLTWRIPCKELGVIAAKSDVVVRFKLRCRIYHAKEKWHSSEVRKMLPRRRELTFTVADLRDKEMDLFMDTNIEE